MGEALADQSERLPWLPNAAPARQRPRPQPRQPRRSWYPLLLAVSAAGAIAFGGWSLVQRDVAPAPTPAAVEPAETVALPPATAPEIAAEPQAPSAAERDALRPKAGPAPAERTATARPKRRAAAAAPRRVKPSAAVRPAAPMSSPAYDPRAWQSGVRGRIIQLGAFATRAQADREWRRVYYRHPLLRPLPPRVVRTNIRGRTYYRLQLGTFSQAHSELLCQRLRMTGEGCIVLGLRGRR